MDEQMTHARGPAAGETKLLQIPMPILLGVILVVALIAFELFNFDTTRFALQSLLGDVRFLSVSWATILAVAFCAIDFAGLVRFFMPGADDGQRPEYWYLTGAWLLGATMNAIMTWWAVSLTLLNHDLGNEILSRATLLEVVPIFVAALVWLTRILFIGSLTVAGSHLFGDVQPQPEQRAGRQPAAGRPAAGRPPGQPVRANPTRPQPARPLGQPVRAKPMPAAPPEPVQPALPAAAFDEPQPDDDVAPPAVRPDVGIRPQGASRTRVQRRPPGPPARRPTPAPMRAKGRE